MEPQQNASPRAVGEIYRDILEWAAVLPRWQQELLRRLLKKSELSPNDVSQLAQSAVAEAEQQASTFSPLSIEDLPSVTADGDTTVLVAVRDLRNVNVLRPDQNLSFGPQLTIVYGDNAAGKSGYARVLKKVYRARVVDDILGDVRADTISPGTPQATFVIKSVDGTERSLSWEEGRRLVEVGRFAVIDAACSVTYVRGGALGVGPAGIDVPRRFAEGVDLIKKQIGREAAAALPDKRLLQQLENESAAGRFVKALSSSISEADIASAATWDVHMASQLESAEKMLSEAHLQTPSARRQQLKSRLDAVESLNKRVGLWTLAVRPQELQAIWEAQAQFEDAEQALQDVERLADSDVPAEALRTSAWVELLRAATAFVRSIDSREAKKDEISIDGRCALCWQLLDDAAAARVARFQQHLAGTALEKREHAAEQRDTRLNRLRSIPDAIAAEDRALVAADEALLSALESLLAAVRSRRDLALEFALSRRPMPAFDNLEPGALQALTELEVTLRAQLSELPSSDTEADLQVRELEQQVLELRTRESVSKSAEHIRDFVENMRKHQRLRNAENAINTRAASSKASELHSKHMTERYAALVDEELRELRFRRRRPILVQKTTKANVEVAPLVSAELKHIPAEKVFSEGERTAIALACFLAELRLGDDSSGLIFDDPISSLDHNIREHVARRIVAVAKQRQVIVFTHDLAFLADLREQAQKIQDVSVEFRTLTATDYAAGFVEDDEPFGARSVKKRIVTLKQLLASAERAARDGDIARLRSHGKEFYEALRSTWERFVEERLFAKVVQRLERNVIVGALGKVTYSKELAERIHEGWRRCSNALEAHDHAAATGGQNYSIEEMKADLASLVDADKSSPPS